MSYPDAARKITNDRNCTPMKNSVLQSSQLETSVFQEAFKNSSAWSESFCSNRNTPSVNLVQQTIAPLQIPSRTLSQISQAPFSKVAFENVESKLEKEAIQKRIVEKNFNQYLEQQKLQQG